MNRLTIKHPQIYRYLSDLDYLRGPLLAQLEHMYFWSFGFYDQEITGDRLAHLFARWRTDTSLFHSDDPQALTGPWMDKVERFFSSDPAKRQKYMVVALIPYLDVVRKGGPSVLGWSVNLPPSQGFKFWEEDGNIKADRLL